MSAPRRRPIPKYIANSIIPIPLQRPQPLELPWRDGCREQSAMKVEPAWTNAKYWTKPPRMEWGLGHPTEGDHFRCDWEKALRRLRLGSTHAPRQARSALPGVQVESMAV